MDILVERKCVSVGGNVIKLTPYSIFIVGAYAYVLSDTFSLQEELYQVENVKRLAGFTKNDSGRKTKTMLQMVNQFSTNFIQVIEGSGDAVSTDSLTVGAKINRLFHERLPLHIGKE